MEEKREGESKREYVLSEWYDGLLEPGTRESLRAVANGGHVGAGVALLPLCDELADAVVHAGHVPVQVRKVGLDGRKGVPVLVDDCHVARVVALSIESRYVSMTMANIWRWDAEDSRVLWQ